MVQYKIVYHSLEECGSN